MGVNPPYIHIIFVLYPHISPLWLVVNTAFTMKKTQDIADDVQT